MKFTTTEGDAMYTEATQDELDEAAADHAAESYAEAAWLRAAEAPSWNEES